MKRSLRTKGSPAESLPWPRPAYGVGAFLLAVSFVGFRTYRVLVVPGQPHAQAWGLQDFRDAIYYPVVALLQGYNPYDAGRYLATYPVGNSFPMYSPLMLLLHLPFGLLPFAAAEVSYFVVSAGLTLVLVHLALRLCGLGTDGRAVFFLGALFVLSEPGQWNLYLGQSAVTLAVATYAALYFASRRRWVAALGFAAVTCKPTWGIPLALLMIARRDVAVVSRGLVIAAALSVAPAALALRNAGGMKPFLAALQGNYTHFASDVAVNPAASNYRVDVVALVGRLLGQPPGVLAEIGLLLCVLGVAAVGVARLRTAEDAAAERLSASLICLAMLICTYHQTYELVLLLVPLLAAARSPLGPAVTARPWLRWITFVALCTPAANYLVDGWTLSHVRLTGGRWLAVTSLNGAALLVAFAAYLVLAYGVPVRERRGLAFGLVS